jgi:uncharacterized membrane protein (UPF0127 family)
MSGATICLLALSLALTCGCGDGRHLEPAPSIRPRTAQLRVAGRDVTVELAADPSTRTRGLMHRASLAPDHGMLFLFTDTRPRQFWMRDTLIGLDIVFLDEDGTVQNVEEAPPGVERPGFHSRRPARFVLEMARGWCREAGLRPGDRIEIPPAIAALATD